MTSSPLNPSQHVERIREILIGRDLQHMHGRILRIEGTLEKETPEDGPSSLRETLINLKDEQEAIRQELQSLKKQTGSSRIKNSIFEGKAQSEDQFALETAARIDARFREILTHFQNELLKFKGELDENFRSLKSEKADRSELSSRFARLASAALEEQDNAEDQKTEGFLL